MKSELSFNPNGLRAVAMLRQFLADMGLTPVERRFPGGIAFAVTFDGPAEEGIAQIVDGAERFAFHFVFTGVVRPEFRLAVCEFITRANWRLIEGNFEMDIDEGIVRFKVGIDFTGTELSEQLVRNAILSGMETVEIFSEGLGAVAEGRLTPVKAHELSVMKKLG